jgi:hypothetical protein
MKGSTGSESQLAVRRLVAALTAAAALGGCVAYAPSDALIGQTADDVAREMGSPTGRYTLPDGTTRLEYARGPFGKHTYMMDLDSAGRVAHIEQVLTEDNFNAIRPGDTRMSVLLRLGRPSEKQGIWRGAELWEYRYDAFFCRWFVITMEPEGGGVRDSGYLPDPMCEDRDRSDWRAP